MPHDDCRLGALLAAAAMAALGACSAELETPLEPAPFGVEAGRVSGRAAVLGAPCFDPGRLHETRLELDPLDWQALRDGYLTNQYFAADLVVDGVRVSQVGVRSRGEGSRDERKPGLKLDTNRYVAGQELHGYKSLVLDNLVTDASLLRERLAFAVFEAMGIAAPRNAFTRLVVNDEYWGVYALVEPVSRPFLQERFGDDGGFLYDYEWVGYYDLSWRGAGVSAYVPSPFEPQTRENDPALGVELVALIRAIDKTPDAELVATLSGWLDVERLLTYVAVENAVVEWDGFVGDLGVNNFYLYELGARPFFVLVPWDKDTSFRAAEWPLERNLELNALTRRLTAVPELRQVYTNAVIRAVTSYVNPRWLGPRLEDAYAQVRDAAWADDKKPFSNEEFELAVGGLRGLLEAREAGLLAQLR